MIEVNKQAKDNRIICKKIKSCYNKIKGVMDKRDKNTMASWVRGGNQPGAGGEQG